MKNFIIGLVILASYFIWKFILKIISPNQKLVINEHSKFYYTLNVNHQYDVHYDFLKNNGSVETFGQFHDQTSSHAYQQDCPFGDLFPSQAQYWKQKFANGFCRKETDKDGTIKTYNRNNLLHSFNDEPATIYINGDKSWWKEGLLHRDNDLPAVVRANGNKLWWKEGLLHRDHNLPAIECNSGEKRWYKEGNEYKPNIVELKLTFCRKETDKDGTIRTYNKLTNQLHSFNDEPAVIYANGSKEWYKEGRLHRDKGKPAVEFSDGLKHWYKEGKFLPDFGKRIEKEENGTIKIYNKYNQLHSFDNNEPAIIDNLGSKFWYKNGKLHRDNDLPAFECHNGTKEWWVNGCLHRDNDKPSIITYNETKQWHKKGKLHRDNDLPAIEYANGTKAWYKEGKCHRDNDLPAAVWANGDNDLPAAEHADGGKFWYKEGKEYKPDLCRKETDKDGTIRTFNKLTNQLHSFNDEPAVVHANGTKYWYKEGKCHRDNDLPAMESNGTKYWYKNGKVHRDNDLPALEYANGTKYWYKEGKRHRDNDLPAIEYANGAKAWYKEGKEYTPDLCRKETDKDGTIRTFNKLTNQLHSFNDEPAVVHANGTKFWYKEGKWHRDENQPAMIHPDGTKEWYKNGIKHRDNDLPAIEYANGTKAWYKEGKEYIPDICRKETDMIGTIKTYNKHNQLHSFNDEPAAVFANGTKHWHKEGSLHRDNDLPAMECSNGDKYWYKNGIKHRDDDKPAVEHANGTKYWYKEGQEYKPDICRKETDIDGTIRTYDKLTNKLHSFNDEPAKIYKSGTKHWYKEGKLHRDNNLPAIERDDGSKVWYKEGEEYHLSQDRKAFVKVDDNSHPSMASSDGSYWTKTKGTSFSIKDGYVETGHKKIKKIDVKCNGLIATCDDHLVKLWNYYDGKLLRELEITDTINDISLSRGQLLYIATNKSIIRINLITNEHQEMKSESGIDHIAVGNNFLIIGFRNTIQWISKSNMTVIMSINIADPIRNIIINNDDTSAIATSKDIKIYDNAYKLVNLFGITNAKIIDMIFADKSIIILTLGKIIVWNYKHSFCSFSVDDDVDMIRWDGKHILCNEKNAVSKYSLPFGTKVE